MIEEHPVQQTKSVMYVKMLEYVYTVDVDKKDGIYVPKVLTEESLQLDNTNKIVSKHH